MCAGKVIISFYMIELEKTYLLKYFPKGVRNAPKKKIADIYFPKNVKHPTLRLRRAGEKYEMTKKKPVAGRDSSEQIEETIPLTKEEFAALLKASGKSSEKMRYYYPYQNRTAEITVFEKKLRGLVLVDVEFGTVEEKNKFEMPEFCLADVTQEKFAAGGMLAGKSYRDLEKNLSRYGYKKII